MIYVSKETHNSIDKGRRIVGLRETVLRRIQVDCRLRMDADSLSSTISEDRKLGLNPFLIVATAGTTGAGAIDPLR